MTDLFNINFIIVLPELAQLLMICALLSFALCFSYVKNDANLVWPKPYAAYGLYPTLQTEPIVKLMIISLIYSAYQYINTSLDYAIGFSTLIWDHLSQFMSTLLCVSAAAALMLAIQALKRFSRYEFILILWLSVLGMLCLIKSYNFLALYLSVELQSLSFYMLAAMRSRTEASAEAGLKYFILSAFSSAILLLGICLIYGSIGSQSFGDLTLVLNHLHVIDDKTSAALSVGLGCVCISLLFKLGAAPFHTWIADVYEGSHTAITAFFAITSKIAVVTVLIRMLSNACPSTMIDLLTWVGVISLVVGSLSAMRQVKLKRLLAFSGVANVGWFLLALISGQWTLLIIHLMVYILLSVTLFSAFITPLFRTHPNLGYAQRTSLYAKQTKAEIADHGADSVTIKYISDLHQIFIVNPAEALAVMVAMFSLAGIPPLAGFYSKYLIINALTQSEHYGVLAFALAAALMSAFYYIRVVKTIYFAKTSNPLTSSTKKILSLHVSSVSSTQQQWFTISEIPTNAFLISFTTAITFLFFFKPDYFCIWLI